MRITPARASDETETDETEELTVHVRDTSDLIDDAEAGGTLMKSGGIDLKDHLSAIEIGLIRKALEEADGTVAGAARLLNIRRTTLGREAAQIPSERLTIY